MPPSPTSCASTGERNRAEDNRWVQERDLRRNHDGQKSMLGRPVYLSSPPRV